MNRQYTVLIAEDEYEIGRSLSTFINLHPHFTVVGYVRNGLEAIEFFQKTLPDVLFTDIRMPLMDGLGLLEYIADHQLPVKTVVVSGYDSFDYVRTAMKYGSVDYLLKPILADQCAGVLDVLLYSLKQDAYTNFDLNVALSHRTELPEHTGELFLLAGCFGNFPFSVSNQAVPPAPWKELVEGVLPTDFPYWTGIKAQVEYLLFTCTNKETAIYAAEQIYEKACNWVPTRYPGLCFTICNVHTSSSLPEIADKLYRELQISSVFCRCVFLQHLTNPGDSKTQSPHANVFEMDGLLANCVKHRSVVLLREFLRGKCEEWKQKMTPSIAMLNYLKIQYINIAQKASSTQVAPIPYEWEANFDRALTQSDSWEQLYKRILSLYTYLITQSVPANAARKIAREIETYICNNYMDPISNLTLAKQFGFVPSYISKIFKEYKGVSPCSYLTTVRIQNAKTLILEDRDIVMQEVASRVGFSDLSYFTKVFKKEVGVTPSEFKKKVIEK